MRPEFNSPARSFFIFKKDTAFYIYRKLGEKTTKKQKDNEEDFMKLE